ncbi:uncharacterized protein LOC119684374 isoform X2 [Teleopsis dalmanni]|uniref:uncharacterized protein LOC119684374 isoform X2 n=1 Tax=Teleopsis dalmanni TaxID=139649 RepID=UPI0018CDBFAC|nr:uncharacterized protein LOC119684374 isoform X2 [Teleopsis dalmanni]XP_037954333.1 uncharacterized protein LOC119684374 isoform X2 [Teleopsis dalmanni]XP_037954334.1 uncharacterized protein LOC119684374 isoform X2 [Teleopsis dalmanni]
MKFYSDRESYGPDFDDRLIQLVRANPAIYDVKHPNYRRNPVRIAIWDRIAKELRAPSRFLQTKWKNIRYNYLQEVKSLETGLTNPNIRKRRFTEDLSFLQNTAQTYNVKKYNNTSYNSSDNDSNSYLYPDTVPQNPLEVIEIEHSDDGSQNDFLCNNTDNFTNAFDKTSDDSAFLEHANQDTSDVNEDNKNVDEKTHDDVKIPLKELYSNPSSPLLTPMGCVTDKPKFDTNGFTGFEPYEKKNGRSNNTGFDVMNNAAKRKAMPAQIPVLTPINDPIELYCLSLVDSLRNMPRSERERVKFEFSKILKDAKYKDQS